MNETNHVDSLPARTRATDVTRILGKMLPIAISILALSVSIKSYMRQGAADLPILSVRYCTISRNHLSSDPGLESDWSLFRRSPDMFLSTYFVAPLSRAFGPGLQAFLEAVSEPFFLPEPPSEVEFLMIENIHRAAAAWIELDVMESSSSRLVMDLGRPVRRRLRLPGLRATEALAVPIRLRVCDSEGNMVDIYTFEVESISFASEDASKFLVLIPRPALQPTILVSSSGEDQIEIRDGNLTSEELR